MPTDQLSTTIAALADPTRRAILKKLTGGQRSVTALAAPFQMTVPAISNVKVLTKASLIQRSRDAQWRPCKLRAAPLKKGADWMSQQQRKPL